MQLAQYILINKSAASGKPMSAGKVASQAAHAAVLGFNCTTNAVLNSLEGDIYTKLILEVPDEATLRLFQSRLKERDVYSELVVDRAPTTEDTAGVATALGVEILDKFKYGHLFSGFELYKDAPTTLFLHGQKITRKQHIAAKPKTDPEPLSPEQQFKALEEFNSKARNRLFYSRKLDYAGFPVKLTGRPHVKRTKKPKRRPDLWGHPFL